MVKKSDYEMTVGAINYLIERLRETRNADDLKMAEHYEELEKRLRFDFFKKYNR